MKSRSLRLMSSVGVLAGLAIPIRLAAHSTITVSISPASVTLQEGGTPTTLVLDIYGYFAP